MSRIRCEFAEFLCHLKQTVGKEETDEIIMKEGKIQGSLFDRLKKESQFAPKKCMDSKGSLLVQYRALAALYLEGQYILGFQAYGTWDYRIWIIGKHLQHHTGYADLSWRLLETLDLQAEHFPNSRYFSCHLSFVSSFICIIFPCAED